MPNPNAIVELVLPDLSFASLDFKDVKLDIRGADVDASRLSLRGVQTAQLIFNGPTLIVVQEQVDTQEHDTALQPTATLTIPHTSINPGNLERSIPNIGLYAMVALGNIATHNVKTQGSFSLTASEGNVTITQSEIRGGAIITTYPGDITVLDCSGKEWGVHTARGNVDIQRVIGDIDATPMRDTPST